MRVLLCISIFFVMGCKEITSSTNGNGGNGSGGLLSNNSNTPDIAVHEFDRLINSYRMYENSTLKFKLRKNGLVYPSEFTPNSCQINLSNNITVSICDCSDISYCYFEVKTENNYTGAASIQLTLNNDEKNYGPYDVEIEVVSAPNVGDEMSREEFIGWYLGSWRDDSCIYSNTYMTHITSHYLLETDSNFSFYNDRYSDTSCQPTNYINSDAENVTNLKITYREDSIKYNSLIHNFDYQIDGTQYFSTVAIDYSQDLNNPTIAVLPLVTDSQNRSQDFQNAKSYKSSRTYSWWK